jgi:hypothetical protein
MKLGVSRKRPLGQEGLEYMREQLSNGGPLSKRLVDSLASGFGWEFITGDQSIPTQPQGYATGGLFDIEQTAALWAAYSEFLREFLVPDSSRALLFENQFFKMSDPCLQKEESLFEWEGVTYHYLDNQSVPLDSATIEEAMTMASDYPRIVLAVDLPPDSNLPRRASLTSDFAEALVRGTKHAVVSAHDGESFVVWSRDKV